MSMAMRGWRLRDLNKQATVERSHY